MYESFEPSQALTPFIECYWSWRLEPDEQVIDDIFPDAAPEFIVHLASPPLVKNLAGEWTQQADAFLYCSAQRTLSLSVTKPMSVFAIRFRPWGVSRFSQNSMANMLDRAVDSGEAFQALGDELVAGLRDCAVTADRIEFSNCRLEQALRNPARYDRRLTLLLEATDGGRFRSADIARTLAMSNRSFNRLWNDVVGIQPRRYLQLMRFHSALAMIAAGEDLVYAAADCGYSDQAHMARQIKQIAGVPPSSLRLRLGARAYRALYESRPGAPWLEQRNVSAP